MWIFLLRQTFSAMITIWLVATLVFVAILAVPGDPAQIILGINAEPSALTALQHQLGLDLPPLQRYMRWLLAAIQGDLGTSINYHKDVTDLVRARLGVSLPLAFGGMLFACLLALPLGILAARRYHTLLDPLVITIAQLGAAIPSFWLGMLLILLFSVQLDWLPAAGFVPWRDGMPLKTLQGLILPIVALGLGQAAIMTRMTRAAFLDVLSQDFIRTAYAKGLPRYLVMNKHALRHALITLITIAGLSLSQLLIGTIVIEKVFAIPGLGSLVLTAIKNRDFPLLQGAVLIYASLIVLFSLVVDFSYGLLDPRVRYE